MPLKIIEPHVFAVMGATGDLMQRKLLPALYHLSSKGVLKDKCMILGVARKRDLDDRLFREFARKSLSESGLLKKDEMATHWCEECIFYQSIGDGNREDYDALAARIMELEREHNLPGNRVFYLALPPEAYPGTIRSLGEARLNRGPGWTRLTIEKPFGRDIESARELNNLVHRYFDESQIFRIDHYLGKETVQNLLTFRFANSIFESLWNRDRIERVEITVAEDIGIERRARYYEQAGALRDMVQNHLTQLLTLVAMEVPSAFDADAIRYEKIKVLRSIMPIDPGKVVRGQYSAGEINGKEVPGYLKEPGVSRESPTETFVAMKLEIDNWRWQGVPFYIRTGKRLTRRLSQIAVIFRSPPVCIFGSCRPHPNVLIVTIQPDEGFDLTFDVKAVGQPVRLKPQRLHFRYSETFGELPDAYKTLLLDVISGDQTLFVHTNEVETSWKLYTPILEKELPLYPYPAGTWGPVEADKIIDKGVKGWTVL